jgi:hypothetical protein
MKREWVKRVIYIFIIFLLLLGLVSILERTCNAEDTTAEVIINVDLIRARLGLAEGVLEKYYMALAENNLDKAWSYMEKDFGKVTPKEEWVKSRELYKNEKPQAYTISEKYCMFIEGTQIGVQKVCHVRYETFISVEYVSVDITDSKIGIASIMLYGLKDLNPKENEKDKDQMVENKFNHI